MTAAELCAAYARVARKHKLPPMTCAALDIETRELADPEAAWRTLTELEPIEGWLLFQSHVAAFAAGSLPAPDPGWGWLLAAETIDAQGRSIHVRQSATGGLLLTIASPADAANADTVFLSDEVQHLATDRTPGPDPKLLYHRRYWRMDPMMGLIPVFAAFQGFTRQKDA